MTPARTTGECNTWCPEATRVAVLERDFERVCEELAEIKRAIADLKSSMTRIMIGVALIAGLSGAGGTKIVGAMMGMQTHDDVHQRTALAPALKSQTGADP